MGRSKFGLAEALGVTASMISQCTSGERPLPIKLAVRAEQVVNEIEPNAVMRWHFRPSDWGEIWPELIGAPGAPGWPPVDAAAVDLDPPTVHSAVTSVFDAIHRTLPDKAKERA